MIQKDFTASCPIPLKTYPYVVMAHGGGGKLMHELIEKMFRASFGEKTETPAHDSFVMTLPEKKVAFTTDSFVVRPLFFPGGDIGSLAVNGTVNDLSMSGARPLVLSLSFILEEGLDMEVLWRIVQSIRDQAQETKVRIVTGDTKVVEKGKGDGLYINTTGIGIIEHNLDIAPRSVAKGDCVIVSGDLGRHGICIMAQREGLSFETTIESDSASLYPIVENLLKEEIKIHCARDLTRGGLASALNEIAMASGLEIHIDESKIPVREDVAAACEILGFDPLYVANEGRCVFFIASSDAQKALRILHKHPLSQNASIIGEVTSNQSELVTMKSKIGAQRIVDMISGEQLPRIC